MRKRQTFKPTSSKEWASRLSKRRVADVCDLSLSFRERNVFFTLSKEGKTLLTKSCGMLGFKNLLKKTSVAAEETLTSFLQDMINMGVVKVRLVLSGFNRVRATLLRKLTLQARRLSILSVLDKTMMPFGGCRPRGLKSRRRRLRRSAPERITTYVRGKSRTR